MNKYQDSKIYKLVNSVDDKIYVGSTYVTLTKRKIDHRAKTQTKNSAVYTHFRDIGFDNVDIVLIESFPCLSKTELSKRERYWIDTLQPELNTVRPFVTVEETIVRKARNSAKPEYIAQKTRYREMPENKTKHAIWKANYRAKKKLVGQVLEK
jgi:group I intron endonuclease